MMINKVSISIVFFFALVCNGYSGEAAIENIIRSIQRNTGLDREKSMRLFADVNLFSESITTDISGFLLHEGNRDSKGKKIDKIIENYFVSESSTVQVSKHDSQYIKSYKARTYLNRILDLKNTYSRVQLIFVPNHFDFSRVETLRNGKYEMSVSVLQLFRGFLENKIVYSDVTRKKFRISIVQKNSNKFEIKASEISVSETWKMTPEITEKFREFF